MSKTYKVLPSKILALSSTDFAFNQMVTGMGFQEDYKNDLVSNLKAQGITPSGKESVKQLEKLLKQKRESTNGR